MDVKTVVGLALVADPFAGRARWRSSRARLCPMLSESIGQSTSQPISAFGFLHTTPALL